MFLDNTVYACTLSLYRLSFSIPFLPFPSSSLSAIAAARDAIIGQSRGHDSQPERVLHAAGSCSAAALTRDRDKGEQRGSRRHLAKRNLPFLVTAATPLFTAWLTAGVRECLSVALSARPSRTPCSLERSGTSTTFRRV